MMTMGAEALPVSGVVSVPVGPAAFPVFPEVAGTN
jgi:hypothetical protein